MRHPLKCLALGGALFLAGCQTGNSGLSSVPIPDGTSQATVQALGNSPGAQEFLARNTFEGTASLSDRSFARGQYLVFTSRLALLPGDTNNKRDIYLRDVRTGEMKVISKGLAGAQADGDSTQASISADGRFVAYRSAATNLVAGDSNGTEDIFVYNRLSGVTTRVSTDSVGTQSNGTSLTPALSAAGRYVVFASAADNLVATDGNAKQDIFVKDTTTGATTLVSSNAALTDSANGASYDPAITEGTTTEGEFIAFATEATDIVGGGLNGQRQIVRVERATPANRLLVSQSAGGAQADGPSYEPSMSTDGSKVAFFTLASNIGPAPDTNSFFDVYLRDIGGNTTTCQSLDSLNNESNGHSGYPSLSADGTVVAFGSLATDLVAGDTNGRFDVFRRAAGSTTRVSVSTSGGEADSDSDIPALSQDGRWVAFRSAAGNVVAHDSTNDDDILVRDTATPSTFWASISCVFPAIWPGFMDSAAFSSEVNLGFDPISLAVGDVDGDGDLDLVTANLSFDNVSIRLNNGSGTYSTGISSEVSVGSLPASVALGDIDGDGDLDLVVANFSSSNVSIRLNDGTGTYSAGTPSELAVGTHPASVALKDVDGDGDLDLLTGNAGSDNVSIRLNDGSGNFSVGIQSEVAVGSHPESFALGDVDGDGHLDLVTGNRNSDNVSIRLNDGSGVFVPGTQSEVGVGNEPTSVALEDVDGDGDLDLVTANFGSNNVSIRLNDGSGIFSAGTQTEIAVGTNPVSVALGDADGDGDLDLVTANFSSDNTSVRINNGDGTFSAGTQSELDMGNSPSSVALKDVNGDGDLDLVTANLDSNSVSIRINDGSGIFSVDAKNETNVGPGPTSVALGDVDGDGYLDLVTSNYGSSNTSIRLNDRSGGFSPSTQSEIPMGTNPSSITLGDIDGDGHLDLLTTNYGSDNVSIRLNDGRGNFSPTAQSEIGVGANPYSVVLGDIDGDGDLDLVTGNSDSSNVSIRFNDGSGNFSVGTQSEISTGINPFSVALGDVDGDGDLDLVAGNAGSDSVSIRLNDGTGVFSVGAQSEIAVGDYPSSVSLGDVDGDGDLDLVTANRSSNDASIRLNDGTGTFSPTSQSEISVGSSPRLSLGDVDGDGDLDIVSANYLSDNASIRLNDGAGTFSAPSQSEVLTGPAPFWAALADLDGDGDLDLMVPNSTQSKVSYIVNLACP